jgi:AcrR family transcriptional regulator
MPASSPAPDRRTEILEAALACFLDTGFAATSIADIRNRSGASTGSIYHFFAGKGVLALALVERATAAWGAAAALPAAGATAEAEIKASVRGLVAWGMAHRREARFLDEVRTLAASDPALADLRTLLDAGNDAARARYAGYRSRGEVRSLPWPLAHALMLGPAYDYLRLVAEPDPGAADLLAEAAWRAVRENP